MSSSNSNTVRVPGGPEYIFGRLNTAYDGPRRAAGSETLESSTEAVRRDFSRDELERNEYLAQLNTVAPLTTGDNLITVDGVSLATNIDEHMQLAEVEKDLINGTAGFLPNTGTRKALLAVTSWGVSTARSAIRSHDRAALSAHDVEQQLRHYAVSGDDDDLQQGARTLLEISGDDGDLYHDLSDNLQSLAHDMNKEYSSCRGDMTDDDC